MEKETFCPTQESGTPTVLASTKSLSPQTLQIIPARIIEENDGIYLEKTDESGQHYKALVEKDRQTYYRSLGSHQNLKSGSYFHLLPVSAQCNLRCKYCYAANAKEEEISIPETIKIAKRYKNNVFVLAGREPTCRSDLPEIINIIARRNLPCLATNGIKLKDFYYLKNLKAAGLKLISFSLNAVDDDILCQMNGRRVLAEKLCALDNIKRLRIPTIISTSILRGVNDGQIKHILKFCINKGKPIYELRIRNMLPFPHQIDQQPYCISDLIDLTCHPLGLDQSCLEYEYKLVDTLNRYLKLRPIERKSCSTFFHIKRRGDGRMMLLGQLIRDAENRRWQKWGLCVSLLAGLTIQKVRNSLRKPHPYAVSDFFRLSFRVWPNIYNVDVGEVEKKCATWYYAEGKETPFCLKNIYRSQQAGSAIQKSFFNC